MDGGRPAEPVDPMPGFAPSDPARRQGDLARGLGNLETRGWRGPLLLVGFAIVGIGAAVLLVEAFLQR